MKRIMPTIKELSQINEDFKPLLDSLLCPLPEQDQAKDVIANYWERYAVQDSCRCLFEMYLRIRGKKDNLAASEEDLRVFMEDTLELLMAVYVSSKEKVSETTHQLIK